MMCATPGHPKHALTGDGPIRVLLVDDDAAYALIVEGLLRRSTLAAFEFESVTTYEAAVTTDITRYHAVLLDYHLNSHTGFELLRAWRARDEETPVIMLTAAGSDAVDLRAAELGAADYLDKVDLTPRALERAIRYAVAMGRSIRVVQEMAAWQGALARAGQSLLGTTDAAAMATEIVRLAVDELGASGAWLGETLADGRVEPLAAHPALPEHVEQVPVRWDDTPAGHGPTGRAIRERAPIVLLGLSGESGYEVWRELALAHGIQCSAAFPMCGPEGVLGALNVYSTRAGFFTPVVVSVFATHAHLAALALRGIRFQEQLRHSQKLEAMGRLAGGVAHDFNNLLTVIIGHASLISEASAGAEEHMSAAEIRGAAERAATLTRQLLAFGRRQIMRPETLDANATIASVEHLLRRLLPENIRIETPLGAAPPWIRADRGQIEQVLVNLAINARDAMPEGGALTIGTRALTLTEPLLAHEGIVATGQYVLLTVSDTGQGMSAATRARIFEPFFTSKPPGKGTGLGLPTVLGIVQQSNGHITVSSEIGRGTTFSLYFPAAEPAAPLTEQR